MISASTLHVISTELTVGMFALSGVAFLLCFLKKGPESREAGAHWALLGGLIATPLAIVTGINSSPGEGFTSPLLANKMLLSMTSVGLAVGVLLRRKWDLVVDARHSSLGMLSVGLMMVTAGIGGSIPARRHCYFLFQRKPYRYSQFGQVYSLRLSVAY